MLAFVRYEQSGHAYLWARNLSTGSELRLTDDRFADLTSPRFSGDGQTLAFGGASFPLRASAAPGNPPGVVDPVSALASLVEPVHAHELLAGAWLVDVDGSNLRQVGSFVLDGPLVRWSSDPQELLLYNENGLYESDLTVGKLTNIFQPGSYRGFDWVAKPFSDPSSRPP
jgi:hypothetical protein